MFKVESPAVTVGGVSVARTAGGRVGIAYDHEVDGPDNQVLHVATFLAPASSTASLDPAIQIIGAPTFSHVGQPSAIAAAGGADTLHIAYVDQAAEELDYQPLVGGATLGPVELVASGIGAGAHLSLAASSAGDVRAAYYVPSTSAVRSAARLAGGGFAPPSELVTGLDPAAPGTGEVSLVLDDQATPDILFQHCEVANGSTPRFQAFDGASWSFQKTIDNSTLSGFAGYSPSLVVHGATKYAAYFFVAGGQSAPVTADLRLAQWQLASDTPDIAVIDSQIPANDPSGTGTKFRFVVAMAIDPFGLLHLVVVRPDNDNTIATLEYVRQAVVDGTVKWLSDVIDGDIFAPSAADVAPDAFAAITVDASARPHIAYRSGKDATVYYATRFDR